MNNMKPPFAIGERVFVAWANAHHQDFVPCPVCFGKLSVVLICGDGTKQPLQCDYCDNNRRPGFVSAYAPASGVREGIITGVALEHNHRWRVTVGASSPDVTEIFRAQKDAEDKAKSMYKQAEGDAKRAWESRFKNSRGKQSWTVGYHRSCIRDLERQLEWHRNKLSAARAEGEGE